MLADLTPDQINSLISAGAGFVGAVIGAGATLLSTWLAKRLQTNGRVFLYARIVHIPTGNHQTWGYDISGTKPGLYLMIPLWLDVCNTSGVSRILRNVNLSAYFNKKEVASFTQIQRSGDGGNAIQFGENGAYTVVVPANSAKRFEMLFMLHETELPDKSKEFDELILTYFDEQNKIHSFHFASIEQCWVRGALPEQKEWITLDRRCRYAR